MKIQHRVPINNISYNMTGKLDPTYEAEVERSTKKLEKEWEKAQKRLESAKAAAESARLRAAYVEEQKAERLERKTAEKEYRLALSLLAEREEELREIEIMMTSSPAGSQNRGNKSYRPVPVKSRGKKK